MTPNGLWSVKRILTVPSGGSPALSVQLTPGGSGQGLEVPRIADFTHRPGLEPATGEEPAPNFLLSQWDHGSRPALPAPKVRENPEPGRGARDHLHRARRGPARGRAGA